MANLISAPRGTTDVLPSESYKWQYIEGILRKCASDFGFSEIRIPTFEHTELFLRGVGDTTDIVQKEMYTFEDKGGRSITLRPEGTASVVRSYLENSIHAAGLPVKCYYIIPNFRYEKPQAGRLREHHQFGVEYFGAAGAEADAETIALASSFIGRLGIENVSLEINSIGCPKCRASYLTALREYFNSYLGELCETCLSRLERNPMRILDCKSEVCSAIAAKAPRGLDYLCDECREHFELVKTYLDAMGIPFSVNTGIVRGFDYYTKTVFEVVSNDLGAQSTVCGGGRYDGLVEELGGKPTPGLGFGSGLERLLIVMEHQGIEIPKPRACEVFIATAGDETRLTAIKLVHALRSVGVAAELDSTGRSLKAQMKYADRLSAKYSIVLGTDELKSGRASMKNMQTGEKIEVGLNTGEICGNLI